MSSQNQYGYQLNRGLEPLLHPKGFQFGTWDIEASDWWNLQLIGAWDGQHYYSFRTIEEFLEFLMDRKYRDWRWFAHFGGRYDFNFLFDWLRTQSKVQLEFFTSGSLVLQMTLRYRDYRVKFCDSFRLFYMPGDHSQTRTDNKAGLGALTKAFNVPHQKMEFDFQNVGWNQTTREYNEWDCRGLYEVIERFFVETGVMSETYASHALKVWRKDFLKQILWKPPQHVTDLVRQTYHGGRVEVFKRQSSMCWAYDVNSMYPYVMQFPMPIEYMGESRRLKDKYYGFVDAEVYIPEQYVPTLPVRREKLYFPVGTIRGQWTAEELRECEQNGGFIQKIFRVVYFKCEKIFGEYVEKLYALKKTAAEPTRTIAKGLLNALYGKFGQNPEKRMYCSETLAPDGACPILQPDGTPSGFAYYEKTSRSAFLLPHLSSAITSKARLHLFQQLDHTVYYCDTDSVFTSNPRPVTRDLGGWSEVGAGEAYFVQPKLYKFKGVWKSKGLGKDQNIDDFVAGNANMVQRAKSIKEALRDGTDACQHVVSEKYLRESRPKREWVGDDTRPWDIREIV